MSPLDTYFVRILIEHERKTPVQRFVSFSLPSLKVRVARPFGTRSAAQANPA